MTVKRHDVWRAIEEKYFQGQLVLVEVLEIHPKYARVQLPGLGERVQSILYVSPPGQDDPKRPEKMLNQGETIQAYIIHMDADIHRIDLSLQQIPEAKRILWMRERWKDLDVENVERSTDSLSTRASANRSRP